jgi:uncharacterized protein (TIGR02588 family)
MTSEGASGSDTRTAGDEPAMQAGRSRAEWITTIVSMGLIVLLAGAILYEGYVKGEADPATIQVTVLESEIERRGDDFYIPFKIVNDGDQTVEEVTIGIELLDGDTVVAEGETVIATLAEAERVTAVLVVPDDPTGLSIEAAVVTYQIAED